MSKTVEPGISQRRADAVGSEACHLVTGINALAAIGGWHDTDSVPAIQVRWFCKRFEEHANRILKYLDICEPEPKQQSALEVE